MKGFLPGSKLITNIIKGIKPNCLSEKRATFLGRKLGHTSLVLITLAGVGLIQCRASTANTITYTVTDLGAVDNAQSQANSVNDIGQIVGISGSNIFAATGVAVLWFQGNNQIKSLGTLPGDTESIAYKINNFSQTVGFSGTDTSHGQAVLWQRDGQPINLGRLANDSASIALSINDRSQVVGFSGSDIFAATPGQAVLWEGSKITPLESLPGDIISVAYGINNWSRIVGTSATSESSSSAVFWQNGGIKALEPLPSNNTNVAFSINDRNQIVGFSGTDALHGHAVLWENGQVKDLSSLEGSSYSAALSINNRGQVVGDSSTANGDRHAFLYTNNQLLDLNNLIPANSGWVLNSANSINNRREIVGYGTINGLPHGFVAKPVVSR
jgi:probable HAF family extracellular repeat protein